MKLSLSLARKKSLQPLLVMGVVICLPVLLTNHTGTAPVVHAVAPDLSLNQIKIVQIAIAILLIGVGLFIWKFGSKKALLRVILTYTIIATSVLCASLLYLIINLGNFGSSQAILLLKDGFVIWWMTALTFSLWYWLLDSGWAESMGMHDAVRSDFAFTQQINQFPGWEDWSPNHIDYLYLGFNTNTAFSPTDVMPLSHRAKVLMMTQSTLALIIMGTVFARAINILAG